MASKKTQYICFNCGAVLSYEELIKKLNYVIEKSKLESYNHQCPQCKQERFLIISIVERL